MQYIKWRNAGGHTKPIQLCKACHNIESKKKKKSIRENEEKVQINKGDICQTK